MHKLSRSTVEKLGYYVYLLIDPRSGNEFYVGKGKGNRINSHLLGALEKSTKETDKIRTIRDIQATNLEVGLIVLRHGLTEHEAFEVESAIIDFIGLEKLTNLVTGHDAHVRGKMVLKDIEIEYQAKPAVFEERALLIRINRLYRYGMPDEELYEATRKYWRIGLREHMPRIVCAVYAGIVREVYIADTWERPPDTTGKVQGRVAFTGNVAGREVREKYLNKSVAHVWKRGSQNPIKYVNKAS